MMAAILKEAVARLYGTLANLERRYIPILRKWAGMSPQNLK
jgi:hypothetical protein